MHKHTSLPLPPPTTIPAAAAAAAALLILVQAPSSEQSRQIASLSAEQKVRGFCSGWSFKEMPAALVSHALGFESRLCYLLNCVILGMLLNSCKPWYLHLDNGDDKGPTSQSHHEG